MDVKIQKIHPNAEIPIYAHDSDAGMDLVAVECGWITSMHHNQYYCCKIGIAIEIPEGYVGLIFPRSSISKTSLALCNAVAVIDSGYRGQIELRFKYADFEGDEHLYLPGDRVGQLIIMPYPKVKFIPVEELSDTDRSSNGFGSTGN